MTNKYFNSKPNSIFEAAYRVLSNVNEGVKQKEKMTNLQARQYLLSKVKRGGGRWGNDILKGASAWDHVYKIFEGIFTPKYSSAEEYFDELDDLDETHKLIFQRTGLKFSDNIETDEDFILVNESKPAPTKEFQFKF